jgi:hypothetical protein
MSKTDLFMETFGDMDNDEYYPASDQKRRESQMMKKARAAQERAEVKASEEWDAHPEPRTIKVNGVPVTVELFTIGALAKAIHKKPVTVRKWMARGILPQAQYRDKVVKGAGQRRYWTRKQVEAIQAIAKEEGLLDVWHPDINQLSRFSKRVQGLFRRVG